MKILEMCILISKDGKLAITDTSNMALFFIVCMGESFQDYSRIQDFETDFQNPELSSF